MTSMLKRDPQRRGKKQGRSHMQMEAEMGGCGFKPRMWWPLETGWHGTTVPHSPRSSTALPAPGFQILASRTARRHISVVEVTKFVVIRCSGPRKQIHQGKHSDSLSKK